MDDAAVSVRPTSTGTGVEGVKTPSDTAQATPAASRAATTAPTPTTQGQRRPRPRPVSRVGGAPAGPTGPPVGAATTGAPSSVRSPAGSAAARCVTRVGRSVRVVSPTAAAIEEGVLLLAFGGDQRERCRGGKDGGQLGELHPELRGVVALGGIGGGGPHQHLAQRPQRLVLGQQGADAGHEGGHGGVADEGGLAGDALVEHEGQAVDVGLAVEHPALHLLGSGVAGRAQHGPVRLGPGRLGQGPGQAEVGDPQPALGVEEQVGRLDVAVDEPAAVGVVEPGAGLDADAHAPARG